MTRRILVTRPQSQAAGLIEAIRSRGDHPVAMPLINIVSYNEQQHPQQSALIKHCIRNLADYQHIICISTNAADAAWQWIERLRPQLPASQHWYAIGAATARELGRHLAQVEEAGTAMDSDSLLQHCNLQQLDGQRVLIFRGNGGREYLKQQLVQRGALVDYCEVYERTAVIHPPGELRQILARGLDFLTVTSTETIQLLLDHAMIDGVISELARLPVVVPGKRIGEFARQRGFFRVIEAGNAGVPAMLEAIDSDSRHKNNSKKT